MINKIYSYLLVLCLLVLVFSCRSVPKEKHSIQIEQTEQTNTETNAVNNIKESADVQEQKKTEEKETTDENTVIKEYERVYDPTIVDELGNHPLVKETFREISNNKNQQKEKTEDQHKTEVKEKSSESTLNVNSDQHKKYKEKTVIQTEESEDPLRWRFIFGICLIVFIASIVIYVKVISPLIKNRKNGSV